jgi:Collagen triple helix repeat (20 copies)
MKKTIYVCFLIFLSLGIFAQAPQKMSYQAVIRDASNTLVVNAGVGMQVSILQGSPTGTAVFVETHTGTTNANGLFSVEIGNGTLVSGSFASINWASGPYFIKTETDPTGGSNYTITGTSQLMSVPYALYAETSGGSGIPGPTGPQGPTGVAGTNGLNGATGATGPQGPTGVAGTNGTNGLNGATGATGPQGPNGVAGTNGTNGLNGATGPTGLMGPTGVAGTNGTNGLNGATGATGPTGANGLNSGYLLAMGYSSTDLVKNSTYVTGYFYNSVAITLFNDRPSRRAIIPASGNVKSVQLMSSVSGTLPSSDIFSITIHNLTQGTQSNITGNYSLSSGNLSGVSRLDNFVLINPLSVNSGDQIQIRISTPNWTTEPIGVTQLFNVYVE